MLFSILAIVLHFAYQSKYSLLWTALLSFIYHIAPSLLVISVSNMCSTVEPTMTVYIAMAVSFVIQMFTVVCRKSDLNVEYITISFTSLLVLFTFIAAQNFSLAFVYFYFTMPIFVLICSNYSKMGKLSWFCLKCLSYLTPFLQLILLYHSLYYDWIQVISLFSTIYD